MAYPGPPPASFLPPSPPRRSRAGGLMLLLSGLLGAAAVWLPWISFEGQTANLKDFADFSGGLTASAPDGLDDPELWFYAAVAGAAIAILFGLIGLAGSKGPNIMAGLFGIIAAALIAYPPAWMLTSGGLGDALGDIMQYISVGFYAAAAAALLALLGAIVAFAGSGRS
jgi:hypothetical protein